MSWIEYKDKGRLVMICILMLLGIIVIVGSVGITAIKRLSDDSKMLYEKELIPAMDMAHILEYLYQNRFHLEEHITGVSSSSLLELEYEMYQNNNRIDSIIHIYFDISHTDKDERYLVKSFSDNIRDYRKVEHNIMKASRNGQKSKAEEMFKFKSYNTFQGVVNPILSYSRSSLIEGKELYEDAIDVSYRQRIVLYVAISVGFVIVVVIGIIVSRAYLD